LRRQDEDDIAVLIMSVIGKSYHHFVSLAYCGSELLDVIPCFSAQLLDIIPYFGAQLLDIIPYFGAQLLDIIPCFSAQLLDIIPCFSAQLLDVVAHLPDVFVLGVDTLEQLAQTEQSPKQDYQHGDPYP